MFGTRIVTPTYQPREGRANQSTGAQRVDAEVRCLERMAARWQRGVELLAQAVAVAPERNRAPAERLLGLGRFFLHAIRTTIHVKQWWQLRQQVLGEADRRRAHALLDELVALAEREIANAQATIPLVEADSRLGWEPSMEYLCDRPHLEWKIAQVRRVLEHEIPLYRRALDLADATQLSEREDMRDVPHPR
jgi:hypothetical protein